MSRKLKKALECFLSTSDASAAVQCDIQLFVNALRTSYFSAHKTHWFVVQLRHQLLLTELGSSTRLFSLLLLIEAVGTSGLLTKGAYLYNFDTPKLINLFSLLLFAPDVSHRVRLKVLQVAQSLIVDGSENIRAFLQTATDLGLHIPSHFPALDGKVTIPRDFGLNLGICSQAVESKIHRLLKSKQTHGEIDPTGEVYRDVQLYLEVLSYLAQKLRDTKGSDRAAKKAENFLEKTHERLNEKVIAPQMSLPEGDLEQGCQHTMIYQEQQQQQQQPLDWGSTILFEQNIQPELLLQSNVQQNPRDMLFQSIQGASSVAQQQCPQMQNEGLAAKTPAAISASSFLPGDTKVPVSCAESLNSQGQSLLIEFDKAPQEMPFCLSATLESKADGASVLSEADPYNALIECIQGQGLRDTLRV